MEKPDLVRASTSRICIAVAVAVAVAVAIAIINTELLQ